MKNKIDPMSIQKIVKIKKIESLFYFDFLIQCFQTNKRTICRLRLRLRLLRPRLLLNLKTFFNSFPTC